MNLRDVLSVLSGHGEMNNIAHGNELCNFVKLVTKHKLGCDPLLQQEVDILACGCGSSLDSLQCLLALLGFFKLQ